MESARKPVIDALRLMRKYDERKGWLLGKESQVELDRELKQLIEVVLERKDIPRYVQDFVRESLRKVSSRLEHGYEREIPELDDYIERLRSVGVPVENVHAELTSIKGLVMELKAIMSDVWRHQSMDRDYVVPKLASEHEALALAEISRRTDDLWNEVSVLVRSVHMKMERMDLPTPKELADVYMVDPSES